MLFLTPIARSAPITQEMRQADKRLETLITLAAPRIYLGELLEQVSAQSHVSITTSLREPMSGARLTISFRRMPLADVLNGLYSLLSFRDAEWRWERTGKPDTSDNYTYHFIITEAARSLPDRLRQKAQAAFEHEAMSLLGAVKMTQQERDALGRKEPETGQLLTEPRTMEGLNAISESVPAEHLPQLLSGKEQVRVPFDKLSARAQEYVRSEFAASQSTSPFPTFVIFHMDRPDRFQAAGLFMEIEHIGGNAQRCERHAAC